MKNRIRGLIILGKDASEKELERPAPVWLELTNKALKIVPDDGDAYEVPLNHIRNLKTRRPFRDRFIGFEKDGQRYHFQYLKRDPEGEITVRRFLTLLQVLIRAYERCRRENGGDGTA